jgi:DnaK suppressor protein
MEISVETVWSETSLRITVEIQVPCGRRDVEPGHSQPAGGRTCRGEEGKAISLGYGGNDNHMKKQDIEGCRRVLEAKKGELLSGRYKAEGITVERVPDSIEETTLEMERNMAVDTLNRRAALLGQVTDALGRVAAGNYGVCLACDNPIPPKRLAALPWAELCLECQQIAETTPSAMTGAGVRLQPTV